MASRAEGAEEGEGGGDVEGKGEGEREGAARTLHCHNGIDNGRSLTSLSLAGGHVLMNPNTSHVLMSPNTSLSLAGGHVLMNPNTPQSKVLPLSVGPLFVKEMVKAMVREKLEEEEEEKEEEQEEEEKKEEGEEEAVVVMAAEEDSLLHPRVKALTAQSGRMGAGALLAMISHPYIARRILRVCVWSWREFTRRY